MMKIEFSTDNAAFHDPDGNYDSYYEGAEICRILKHIGSWIANADATSGNVVDINGNVIGRWSR